jgi:HAD superfamily hydrolase (TIGR01450 family)
MEFMLEEFEPIASQYPVLLFDSYGVIKSSKGLVPGIERTFEWLKAEKKEYYIITNDASRSPKQLAQGFHKMGLKAIQPERIISSGMLAKEFLNLKVRRGKVAYLGTEDSAHYIEHRGMEAVPINDLTEEQMQEVVALVLLDDEGFDWVGGINKSVNLLRRRAIPAIVANADGAYPVSSHDVSVAIGGLSWLIEKIVGKKFIRFGKPDAQIFMFAWEILQDRFPGIKKKDALMIGDTLQTDILGGNKFGLDTMLVLTGNTLPQDYLTRIMGTGITPTYICHAAVVER